MGKGCAKPSTFLSGSSPQVSQVECALSEDIDSPLCTPVVLGENLEFPDELPTGKGWEAANSITSPFGSDANLHHHYYSKWREKRLS